LGVVRPRTGFFSMPDWEREKKTTQPRQVRRKGKTKNNREKKEGRDTRGR